MTEQDEVFALLRRIRRGGLKRAELEEIYDEHRDSYRIKNQLVQHPLFPAHQSLSILGELYNGDLIRVLSNPRVNPFVRKSAETEFLERYRKMGLGERKSAIIRLPEFILTKLAFEKNPACIRRILHNPRCTQRVVVHLLTAGRSGEHLYRELVQSRWIRRREVVDAVVQDPSVPVRALVAILPTLSVTRLKQLRRSPRIHSSVKQNIDRCLKDRRK